MGKAKLPVNGSSEYYEIRLESIGGLGANLCGKMLGELGVKYLGLQQQFFQLRLGEDRNACQRIYKVL